MLVYRYRIYPDEADPLIRKLLDRGHRFARRITEIEQAHRERRAAKAADAASKLKAELAEARAHSGINWRTYNTIRAARDQAAKTAARRCVPAKEPGTCACGEAFETGSTIWLQTRPVSRIVGCQTCGRGLRMPSLEDYGAIGGQVCAGNRHALSTDELTTGTSRYAAILGQGKRRTLRYQAGSAAAQEWIEVPIVYHRDLPAGVDVLDIRLSMRRVGHRRRWHVLFTLDTCSEPLPSPTRGAVGVDLRWRQLDGALCVAAWEDDSGERGTIEIPAELVARFRKTDELRSLRDVLLNRIYERLQEQRRIAGEEWPEWLLRETASLHAWRSPARFERLLRRWRAHERGPAEKLAFESLRDWYRFIDSDKHAHGESHLREWEMHQRERCLAQRRELYRLAARRFAEYREVRIENLDLAAIAAVAKDPDERMPMPARRNRMIAAVGELRKEIESATSRSGGRVVFVDASNTSRTCTSCGAVEDPGAALEARCPHCSAVEDVRFRAARNVLRAVGCCDDTGTRSQAEGGDTKRESAWSRRKAAKKQRETEGRSQRGAQPCYTEEESMVAPPAIPAERACFSDMQAMLGRPGKLFPEIPAERACFSDKSTSHRPAIPAEMACFSDHSVPSHLKLIPAIGPSGEEAMPHKYTVGQPYNPKIRKWPETPQYNVRRGHHELVLFLEKPDDREVKSVRRGPAEFALHVEPPVLLMLFRFEPALQWCDAPFSIHLVPESERELPASLLTPEARALLHLLLVDASTGILLAIRAVSLSAPFTAALHGAIRAQAVDEWSPAEYDAKLQEIYRRAQSDALARGAPVRCRGGE